MKPDCYSCLHRGEVPGSAHSSCRHPSTNAVHAGLLAQLATVAGKRSGLTEIPCQAAADLHIEGVAFGIDHGYFLWPANFDPTWLVRCDGFEAKP